MITQYNCEFSLHATVAAGWAQEQVAAMEDCNNNTKQPPHSTAVSLVPAARIAVIGTGNFGTALVTRLRQAGAEVDIYTVFLDSIYTQFLLLINRCINRLHLNSIKYQSSN